MGHLITLRRPPGSWVWRESQGEPGRILHETYQNNTIVVNVILPGHPLFPGYAARIVTTGNGAATIQNVGEGLAPLQGKFSPFANTIDNACIPVSQNDINNTH